MIRRTQQLDDVLQHCLERIENGASIDACLREYPSLASELAPLLEATEHIRSWEIPQQRGVAREAAKVRAHAALAAQLSTAPPFDRRWHHTSRLVWRYAAALAIVFALFGTSVAIAQDDLPGDLLYSVKRGSEEVRLGLARTPSSRAELYLDFAQRRLNECLALNQAQRSLDGSLATIENGYAQAWDAISLVPPEERVALVERYQNDVQIQQEVLTTALSDVPSASSRSILQQVLEAMRDAQKSMGRFNSTAVPAATPSEQRNSIAMSPTPASDEIIPVATTKTAPAVSTTTLMTSIPLQPTVQTGSRTVTIPQTPRPRSTQPDGKVTQIPIVSPTLRTNNAAPTQPAAQTLSPGTQVTAMSVATIHTPPPTQPTNDNRPSPRPIYDAHPTPVVTEVPRPRTDESTPPLAVTETPPAQVRPSPQPTNDNRPTPRPTNDNRP